MPSPLPHDIPPTTNIIRPKPMRWVKEKQKYGPANKSDKGTETNAPSLKRKPSSDPIGFQQKMTKLFSPIRKDNEPTPDNTTYQEVDFSMKTNKFFFNTSQFVFNK